MSGVLSKFLIGKVARPAHPATCLNPNGRKGFVITEVERDRDNGNFYVRGEGTMWFGEGSLIEICERVES